MTLEELKKLKPCSIEWVEEHLEALEKLPFKKQIGYAVRHNKFEEVIWLLVNLMKDKKQLVEFSIYCAEPVLPIFEKEYPEDKRPRKAIESAEDWLKNPCVLTSRAAAEAAESAKEAANVAANVAEDWAAARSAGFAAANAAWAASAAREAACAASWAASFANESVSGKILRKAFEILNKQEVK